MADTFPKPPASINAGMWTAADLRRLHTSLFDRAERIARVDQAESAALLNLRDRVYLLLEELDR